MTRAGKIAVVLAILIFLALQAHKLVQPFVGEFEAGFQEMIAVHHLRSGVVNNHFLPVIAEVNDEKFYHTAHPPLLHIIYYALYRIFGVHEWVSRGFCLFLMFGSIFLLSQMVSREKRTIFWLIALFFPISFRLGLITNYEPLSIFSICLFLFCFEKARQVLFRKWILPLLLSVLLIALSDWPGYLAIPALFLIYFREPAERKWLAGLFVIEMILFLALILYMRSIAGEVALFAHSWTRSNPVYLFNSGTYMEFFEHLKWIAGKPALVLILLAALKLILGRGQKLGFVISFWIIFLILLWVSASNLVSRHFVYLNYLFPLLALVLTETVSRLNHQNLATIIILLSFVFPDYLGLKTKDARYYYLANSLKSRMVSAQDSVCFSSSAIGILYFYDRIETVIPVSKKATQSLAKNNFPCFIIDMESREVKELAEVISTERYSIFLEFPGLKVFLREDLSAGSKYLATELDQDNLKEWWMPKAEALYIDGNVYYGLKQPPGPAKISRLDFHISSGNLCFQPAIYTTSFSNKSDGVNFMVIALGQGQSQLSYARFLRDKTAEAQKIEVKDFSQISLITDSGPKANFSYDDAYWLEARVGECGGKNGD